MTREEEELTAIATVIERHCPNVFKTNKEALSSYANHVYIAHKNCHKLFNVSPDVSTLSDLEKLIGQASDLLNTLSEQTINDLNLSISALDADILCARSSRYLDPDLSDAQATRSLQADRNAKSLIGSMRECGISENNEIIMSREAALTSLLRGVQKLRSRPEYVKKSSSKRNYRAIAVAWACRKVWREELNPGEIQHWKDYPNPTPKQINPLSKNHPYESFLADMFDALRIGCLPNSALAALEKLGGEEAVTLLVENG
ncbi:hypothetical protein [Leisingera sp. ANG-DT]|uniref:hypothetical protein n=1 Tax=Leisingera sp. ANG-DT TaxID=1577897 RepID=UPI00057E0E8E|nr:hypothetical protein [Leisingera sp. ANG-DT]KIC18506.1 hypothetical protein RA21_04415 [Leisingera sp. ANG-DT]